MEALVGVLDCSGVELKLAMVVGWVLTSWGDMWGGALASGLDDCC